MGDHPFFLYNRCMSMILIGKVARPFGVRGEIKIVSYTDFGKERFKKGSTIYLGLKEDNVSSYEVSTFREDGKGSYIKLLGIDDMNASEKLRDYMIYKASEDIKPLPKGSYYFSDLENLKVFVEGEEIGFVKRVEDGISANYLRIVLKDKSEKLVPFLPIFIKNVDLENQKIEVIKMARLL